MWAGEREGLSFIELAHLMVALASPDSIGRAGRLGISESVGGEPGIQIAQGRPGSRDRQGLHVALTLARQNCFSVNLSLLLRPAADRRRHPLITDKGTCFPQSLLIVNVSHT